MQAGKFLALILDGRDEICDFQFADVADLGFGLFVFVFLTLFAQAFGGFAELLVDFIDGGLFGFDFFRKFCLVFLEEGGDCYRYVSFWILRFGKRTYKL